MARDQYSIASISGDGSSISAQNRSRIATVSGPGLPSPIGCPSSEVIGVTPPAVVTAINSSASYSSWLVTSRRLRLDTHRVGELEHRLAGDAGQRIARRRCQLAVLDDDHVEPRALGDAAVGVHQDRCPRAAVLRLEAGRGEVAPLVVLDRSGRRCCVPRAARDGARSRWCRRSARAAGTPTGTDRVDVHLGGQLGQVLLALALSVTSGDREVDEGLAQLRHRHALLGDLRQLRPSIIGDSSRSLRAPSSSRSRWSLEPEDVAVPHVRHGVGDVGVTEAGVEDRDPGLRRGHVLAFDPCHATGERARGVQFVVAVLDHRTGGVSSRMAPGLDGDQVACGEIATGLDGRHLRTVLPGVQGWSGKMVGGEVRASFAASQSPAYPSAHQSAPAMVMAKRGDPCTRHINGSPGETSADFSSSRTSPRQTPVDPFVIRERRYSRYHSTPTVSAPSRYRAAVWPSCGVSAITMMAAA